MIAPNIFDLVFRANRPTWLSDGLFWTYIGPGLRKQDLGNILEWWLMGEHFWEQRFSERRISNM